MRRLKEEEADRRATEDSSRIGGPYRGAGLRPQLRGQLDEGATPDPGVAHHDRYAEIVVRGKEFVSVHLTNEAHAHGHGLAAAMLEGVEVPVLPGRGRPQNSLALARPTGFKRADDIYIRIPIEGGGEWQRTSSESA
jgi:hypothetical protein